MCRPPLLWPKSQAITTVTVRRASINTVVDIVYEVSYSSLSSFTLAKMSICYFQTHTRNMMGRPTAVIPFPCMHISVYILKVGDPLPVVVVVAERLVGMQQGSRRHYGML